jgi:rare lipoprotein A
MRRYLFILLSFFVGNQMLLSAPTIFTGNASWYGEKFHGRLTANGEIFNMNDLTAAHKTLPFGTILEVTNLNNHKSVKVRVNDRGPFVKNRVLDLSKKAAQVLEYDKKGVIPIEARIVKLGNHATYHKNTLASHKPTKVQDYDDAEDDSDFQDEDSLDDEENSNPGISNTKEDDGRSLNSGNQGIINTKNYTKSYENNSPQQGMQEIKDKQECPLPKGYKCEQVESNDTAIVKVSPNKESVGEDTDETDDGSDSADIKVNRIFVIQFGAFSDIKKAQSYQMHLNDLGIETYIAKEGNPGAILYKVRQSKTYRNLKEVFKNVLKFKKMGLDTFAVGKFFVSK